MLYEYKKVHIEHFDCNVLFYGMEQTVSDYSFSGNNMRDYYVLHYIVSGKGSFASAGNQMTKLEKGDVFILPKSVPCFYQADHADPWKYFWIGFSGSSLREILSQSQIMERHYLKNVMTSKFNQSLETLFDLLHHHLTLDNRLLVHSYTCKTFYHLLEEYPHKNNQAKSSSYEHFNQAVLVMKENLNYGYNVSDVDATLHLSRGYLHAIFKKYADTSPQQYLLNLKIESAKELLKESGYPLKVIASMVGYKDQFTFSKAFKRITNCTPQNYRKK